MKSNHADLRRPPSHAAAARLVVVIVVGTTLSAHVTRAEDSRSAALPKHTIPKATVWAADDDSDGESNRDVEWQLAPIEISDEPGRDGVSVRPAAFQPQPPLQPSRELQPATPVPQTTQQLFQSLFGGAGYTLARDPGAAASTNIVLGTESKVRVATDAGSLLKKSPSVLGLEVQSRTPIVNDPRVRGSQPGRLAASGSYWVPARADLDTALSKFDSRLLDEITVIKGPYSALYGPGFYFIDVGFRDAPRFDSAQVHGATSADYQTNGEQVYGRQSLWGGENDWGFRFDYGHRTGNDYTAGNGDEVPSSYKSREALLALGFNPTPDSVVNFHMLRLDQTDVEFPGQAFDINYLVTDGYDLEYIANDSAYADRIALEGWYNRTRFEGDNFSDWKRRQFPLFDQLNLRATTDVDSMSTGYRFLSTWDNDACGQTTIGTDLRFIKQELNELASGENPPDIFQNANSPIPRSDWVNPGLLVEHSLAPSDTWRLKVGGRIDFVDTDVIEDPNKLQDLGIPQPQSSLADILGTDDFHQEFPLWAAFLTSEHQLTDHSIFRTSGGYAQRAPTLTELYAAQPFLFLMQSGENIATGDPRLNKEQRWQIDVALDVKMDDFRAGATGFYAWIHDYITFENLGVVRDQQGEIEQVSLKYVNTDLATLVGTELYAEYDAATWLTPFATMSYLNGRDRTRNGSFATRGVEPTIPSIRVPGVPRGDFSMIPGAAEEPLPMMPPLESTVGFRVHEASLDPRWSVEVSARIVTQQNRVAPSLVELPTPGFTVFNLRSYWQAKKNLLLVAGVENFTNKNYREYLDFRSLTGTQVYQPGISFYFGTELTY